MSASGAWMGNTAVALKMIKFSHSIFALPFALASLLLASQGKPSVWVVSWVVVAMVGARSAAMAFNRLVDQRIDHNNPRTRDRALPAGEVTPRFVVMFVVISIALFVLAAAMLNPLCLSLSPVALVVILGYSFAKRFTALCHLWLGVALGITPLAGWVAVTGQVDGSIVTPLLLGFAVLFWVAGFDVIYACQDADFDREAGLYSIPARLGVRRALYLAASFHLVALGCLIAVATTARLNGSYYGGVAVVAVLLAVEHWLAWPLEARRLQIAFFHVNSWVGVVMLAAVVGELYW